MKPAISFIGGGNMARSIIGGLIASGFEPDRIHVSDPQADQRRLLESRFKVTASPDNASCVTANRILVLAVKPQVMQQALASVQRELLAHRPMLISIAAGIRIRDMLRWAGCELPLIRAMPNTPALVNCGVSGLFANTLAEAGHRKTAEQIMQSVGAVVWLDRERDIDTVTGISGSGPAYFFRLMEIMMESAREHGLDAEAARTLVLETARGAARLAVNDPAPPSDLRRQVTSPRGTTEAALKRMEEQGIEMIVKSGIDAAIHRSDELATQLGDT